MNIQKYDSLSTYVLTTGEIAGGAGAIMFDIFNATGGQPPLDILLLGLYAIPKTDVAVTGVVSARFDLMRTKTVGTGGTGYSYASPATDALNISPFDSLAGAIPSQITSRQAPSGGATATHWLQSVYMFPEETNAAAITIQNQNLLPDGPQIEPFVLHPDQGLVILQGTVASVNSFVFRLVFGLAGSNAPL